MKPLILTFFALFIAGLTIGQTSRLELSQLGIFNSENNGQARIYINQDSQLNEIILSKAHVEKDYSIWRVQIYLGTGKSSRGIATSTQNNFKGKYPDVSAELIYRPPYFEVDVGNFKTRIEAESFKQKIIGDYSKCRVVSEVNKSKK
jgi:hypothetical protein